MSEKFYSLIKYFITITWDIILKPCLSSAPLNLRQYKGHQKKGVNVQKIDIIIQIQLHNWTFFHDFPKEDCKKKLSFFSFYFFFWEKRFNFSSFHFSILKPFLHKFYVLLFFPVKKDLFFTVLKLSTIKQAFFEKVQ